MISARVCCGLRCAHENEGGPRTDALFGSALKVSRSRGPCGVGDTRRRPDSRSRGPASPRSRALGRISIESDEVAPIGTGDHARGRIQVRRCGPVDRSTPIALPSISPVSSRQSPLRCSVCSVSIRLVASSAKLRYTDASPRSAHRNDTSRRRDEDLVSYPRPPIRNPAILRRLFIGNRQSAGQTACAT